ncbi:MAG: AraC family transcriptional regulator [Verrucomicrobiales bacterium]|nr:AraC family transcriptional regulator [Verrucomicrobiales bacterium]
MSAHLHVSRLYQGRCVSISDVRCRPQCRQCGGEEHCEAHQIVFVRAGVFVKKRGRRELVDDPNQVLFFNRHEPYRVSHPVGDGDDCTAFAFRSEVLRDAIEAFAPCSAWERPFEFELAMCSQPSFLLQQRLRHWLRAGTSNRLAVEEVALNLLSAVTADAYRARGVRPRRCRAATSEAHRHHAEMTRLLLAVRFAEDLTLDDLARAVYSSPFHLARIFRRECGLSIHQYRTRLRLRAALERIDAGAIDLMRLALDLGFSSHSHLTDVFHRAFGLSPSACRKLPLRSLREMSTSLKVGE